MAKKEVILVAGALLLLAAMNTAYGIEANSLGYANLSSTGYIGLEKADYFLGDIVNINLSINTTSQTAIILRIFSDNTTFSYHNAKHIDFRPGRIGNYTVQILIGNK